MAGRSVRQPPRAWLLLAILLWLNNRLRYICDKSEFNVGKPADRGRAARAESQVYALPKKEAKMSIEQFIDNEVKSNDVVLFMKGTPQFPQCGFSGQVVQILDHVGVGYKGLNVLESADLRNGIKTYSNWPTIPQLYVKGEFVGGCDIIREMFQAGELQSLMKEKGLPVKADAPA
jgi:monothiol glutaredoxin